MKFFIQSSNLQSTDKSKQKKRNDIILIVALLAVVIIASVAILLFRSEGDIVTVSVDGHSYGKYSLNENITVKIKSNDGYNILVIEDGQAYVESASCPDGICSSHRPVKHDGESIICLPNKVVIEIHSNNQNEPDIIA